MNGFVAGKSVMVEAVKNQYMSEFTSRILTSHDLIARTILSIFNIKDDTWCSKCPQINVFGTCWLELRIHK